MSDNIPVNPALEPGAVDVATDEITDSGGNITHYPVYKMALGADGEAVLISTDNKLPVEFAEETYLINAIHQMVEQLKIMNLHLSLMTDAEIKGRDIE